jgi:hypothetical protein
LIAVSDHLDLHDFKYNLLDLVSSEVASLDHFDTSRLKWLKMSCDMFSPELLNEVWLEANLTKSSLPSFLPTLLNKELLDLKLLHLTGKGLLMEQMGRRLLGSGTLLLNLTLKRFVQERVGIRVSILLAL